MPPPHPPLSRSFWLLQKPLVSTPSPLHQWSPTQSFAFSILAFFHIFRFILSHLLFTCFSSFPPPCFASLLLCGSTEPHLNAQPVISSLPALGIFIGMKKCNHPFSFWYISTRVDTELLKWTDSTLFLHILVVQCMKILIFHSLLCGVARYLVLSCRNRAHRLSSACSLACRQADQERQGRGEESVRRRERVANEVWVKIMGDWKREQWPSPGYGEKEGGGETEEERDYTV